MTSRKPTTSGKTKGKKLALKKETLRDLDPGLEAQNVKGGVIIELGVTAIVLACISTLVCPEPPVRKTKR